MKNIALIDDDNEFLFMLSSALAATLSDVQIFCASTIDKARALIDSKKSDVVILDLCLDKEGPDTGFNFLSYIIKNSPTARVIILTGSAESQHGVKALSLGAAHFIAKPPEISHLVALIKDSFSQAELRAELLKLKKEKTDDLIGSSTQIIKVKEDINYAASNNLPVLITGETGTGKGFVAYLIHTLSKRMRGKFVRYQPNFGSYDLVQSELFGHIKGSFTGAVQNRAGLLRESTNGTFFLDEIAELNIESQINFLEVLQNKKLRSVGSDVEESVDFRLISATNSDLIKLINERKFRSDLYYRIAQFEIFIPPLRDRREDIPLLVDYKIKSLQRQEGLDLYEISEEAKAILYGYDWIGNCRELFSVVESAAYIALHKKRRIILTDDIKLKRTTSATEISLTESIQRYKRKLVMEALNIERGNQQKAAKRLGIDRNTVRRLSLPKEEKPKNKTQLD